MNPSLDTFSLCKFSDPTNSLLDMIGYYAINANLLFVARGFYDSVNYETGFNYFDLATTSMAYAFTS